LNGTDPIETLKEAWPVRVVEVQEPVAARSRAGLSLALFITGFATFVNLYATQPLLPQFRQIFHASELMVSLTVSAPVLAVALAAPLIGLLAIADTDA
jgi:predicted MFS family arabinose efflux permease